MGTFYLHSVRYVVKIKFTGLIYFPFAFNPRAQALPLIRSPPLVAPMFLPCNSHFPPILRNGPETDLKRTWNGITTDLLLWQKETIDELFFRIKRQTYTRG